MTLTCAPIILLHSINIAGVAELADARDSKSRSFGSVGSTPTFGTDVTEVQSLGGYLRVRFTWIAEQAYSEDVVLWIPRLAGFGELVRIFIPASE